MARSQEAWLGGLAGCLGRAVIPYIAYPLSVHRVSIYPPYDLPWSQVVLYGSLLERSIAITPPVTLYVTATKIARPRKHLCVAA